MEDTYLDLYDFCKKNSSSKVAICTVDNSMKKEQVDQLKKPKAEGNSNGLKHIQSVDMIKQKNIVIDIHDHDTITDKTEQPDRLQIPLQPHMVTLGIGVVIENRFLREVKN